MTINIDGRTVTRTAAIAAATLGVGAAAFFGGTATRMSDDARASEKATAVEIAVTKADTRRKIELAVVKKADLQRERKHVKKMVRKTVKRERNRAEKLAETARNEGYTDGSAAGYGSGHSAGKAEGYSEGEADGYESGSVDGYWDGYDDGYYDW
jgi:flagellar biosynthesis/type III secretory pathway protein FliH